MKIRISLSILVIAVPLLIRGSYSIILWLTDFYLKFVRESLNENNYSYPVYYVLYYGILDLLPMGCQLLTVLVARNQDDRSTFKSDYSSSQEISHENKTYNAGESIIDNHTFIER